jgi:hypothetical protein
MDDYYDNFYHLMSEAIYDIFWEEFNRSKIIQSPYNYLQNFQIILEQMPLWNTPTCEKKWEYIMRHSNCDWLEDYMKIVFFTKMKTLIDNCFEPNTEEKEVEEIIKNFKCPSKEEFIRETLTKSARNFYENPFLFKNSSTQEKIEKAKKIKEIIENDIKLSIQKFLPSKLIIKKCKPENILKKKKPIYSSIASQCDIIEHQTENDLSFISSENYDSTKNFDSTNVTKTYENNETEKTISKISNKEITDEITNVLTDGPKNENIQNELKEPVNQITNESYNQKFDIQSFKNNQDNYQMLEKMYTENIYNKNKSPNLEGNQIKSDQVITVSIPKHVMEKVPAQFQENLKSRSNSPVSQISQNNSSAITTTSNSDLFFNQKENSGHKSDESILKQIKQKINSKEHNLSSSNSSNISSVSSSESSSDSSFSIKKVENKKTNKIVNKHNDSSVTDSDEHTASYDTPVVTKSKYDKNKKNKKKVNDISEKSSNYSDLTNNFKKENRNKKQLFQFN